MLVVRDTQLKGRGVFAEKNFAEGELIEKACVIVIPKKQVKLICQTVLFNYYFTWRGDSGAIALGLASLFNHSYHPNAFYVKNFAQSCIEIIAYKDISIGEEITVNYNGRVDDLSPVWFESME